MSTVKKYRCTSKKQTLQLFKYYEKLGYRWSSGTQLTSSILGHPDEDGGCVYMFYPTGKIVKYSRSIHAAETIETNFPFSIIKPEFEKDFKKLFRLNKVPLELTEEQKEEMKRQKTYELWMDLP